MRYFKPRNLLLVLALILTLILLAVIALRYRTESQLQSLVKALPKGIDVSLQDIDYTHLEEGRARWRLVAQEVERQSESGVLGLVAPQLSFYDEQGEVKGSLKAGKGDVSDDYQQVRLRGDVVLENSAGYSLYTESIDYDHTTQMATTDAHVRMVADGVHLEGTGLVFYLKQDRLQLKADVKGSLDSKQME
ncbi:MAG: LPS export ABC transporter periplasmic protein LptC [Desulfuromonadales bacterium]|nr:LPS export ABC transporter periplasmic protein LptC [Desulfuromonadales bacterium]